MQDPGPGPRIALIGSDTLDDANGGVMQVDGLLGKAAGFSSGNHLMSTAPGLAVAGGTFWLAIRFKLLAMTTACLIGRRLAGSLKIDFEIRAQGDGSVTFFTSDNGGTNYNALTWTGAPLTAGNWYTAMAYSYVDANPSLSRQGLSINGGNFQIVPTTFPTVSSGITDPFTIGALSDNNETLSGDVNDAGIGVGYVPTNADASAYWNGGAGAWLTGAGAAAYMALRMQHDMSGGFDGMGF